MVSLLIFFFSPTDCGVVGTWDCRSPAKGCCKVFGLGFSASLMRHAVTMSWLPRNLIAPEDMFVWIIAHSTPPEIAW